MAPGHVAIQVLQAEEGLGAGGALVHNGSGGSCCASCLAAHHSQAPQAPSATGNHCPHVAEQLRLRPELALRSAQRGAQLSGLAARGSPRRLQRSRLLCALCQRPMQRNLHMHHVLQRQLRKVRQAAHGSIGLQRQVLRSECAEDHIRQQGLQRCSIAAGTNVLQGQGTQRTKVQAPRACGKGKA
jgi:hypothetical protein